MNIINQLQNYFPNKQMIISIDSDICGMNNLQKEMNEKMIHKSNHCIILIDNQNQIFGGIIFQEISQLNEWIEDDKSMLFSIDSLTNTINTFPIQNEESQYAFYLYSFPNDSLFAFG